MAFYYHKLRALRKAKGLSQAELAQQLGLGKSTIAMYECGKRTPEFETIEAICDFFNVNMSDLSDSKLAIRLSDLVSSVSTRGLDTLFTTDTKHTNDIKAPAPEPSPSYYVDPETAELADRLKNQPGMRMLFDASRKASPKDLEIAANLLKQLKGED